MILFINIYRCNMNNNYIKVKLEGKNVNNYIKWLIKQKINIINLKIIKYNELEIIIEYKNYSILSKYSKTYKITILEKYGKLKLIEIIKKNAIKLICIIFAIIFLNILSNTIFSVDIIYNDKQLVELLKNELSKYNIKKYSFKKNYKYLTKVKEKILKENKDKLEWIEIEESGTKYIVKIVERKKEIIKKEYEFQSIVAKKNAIITSIKSSSGENVKTVNQIVKKGETIISGIIQKPDGTNIYLKSKGNVYGEVWYKIEIEYPLYYQEEKVTGKNKQVITLKALNYSIALFPYKKYKQFQTFSKTLLENNLLPLKIQKEALHEVNIKEEIYTIEEATNKAIEKAKKKLLEKNNQINSFKNVQILEKQNLNSKIKLIIFVSAIEDITDIVEINKEELEKEKENIEN